LIEIIHCAQRKAVSNPKQITDRSSEHQLTKSNRYLKVMQGRPPTLDQLLQKVFPRVGIFALALDEKVPEPQSLLP
jgi:hypothetical protein